MFQDYSSIIGTIHRERLLERFLNYVRVGTSANGQCDRYPSSEAQRTLGSIVAADLKRAGLSDVHQDENGLVWGRVPASVPGTLPTILLNAHLDTSPEAPGESVCPQVIKDYGGGPIPLPKGPVICDQQCPELQKLRGKTLITTDGSTLLGGDDKAGVAIITELAAHLIERPHLRHGPIQVVFTCDEEIGRGTKHFDPKKAGAVVGYTLDGGGAGTIDQETFSADMAVVEFIGSNIHPAIAKGRMVNAVRAAAHFISKLPREHRSPESTDGRQGFIHPFDIEGGVGKAKVQAILRDFDTEQLGIYAAQLEQLAAETRREFPGLKVEVKIQRQYRNMADGLKKAPMAVELARKAFENLGRPCELGVIRGGTDGALMTEMGLPTPNLSSGQYNIHSVLEFACLDEMVEAVEHLIVLLDLWQQHSQS